ncbi:erythromycin esterase [Crossiella equi]|uniref:Erythromycin esterase n=1 Tax=Crossiella equi TaxID=130796 RepID=A0ABS5A7I8_9PSEU|nr:erythromycin esterase family protein [Crossiella equi]MBP2472194.1 erythromycin esterase [Crossiella equi]
MSPTSEQAEVISWMAEHAIPLRSAEPGEGVADLAPLATALAGVQVVGLGEATHGTREFFTLKHRLVEFLVTKLGFTVFAIEAGWSNCRAVDDYVVHGAGSASEALNRLGYWTWDTDEVLTLIEWLREHNSALPVEQRVRFRGIDPVLERVGRESVADYLSAVDGDRAEAFLAAAEDLRTEFHTVNLRRIAGELFRYLWRKLPGVSADPDRVRALAARDTVRDIAAWLAEHPVEDDAWREARWHLWAIERAAELRALPLLGQQAGHLRDRFMGEAVRRILAERPGAKVAVWAHNGHLAAANRTRKEVSLGAELRAALGEAYYALALVTNEGGFQAVDLKTSRLAEFVMDPAEPGTVEWHLAQAGGDCALDLRAARDAPRMSRWLAGKNRMRAYGSMIGLWSALRKESAVVHLSTDFDGLAYLSRTTRARTREVEGQEAS